MDDANLAIELGRQAIMVSLLVSAPILAAGLVVGLAVSVFQAVTQIHEMTLTFIPKIVAMTLVMVLVLPWMLNQLLDYTRNLFERLPVMF